MGESISDIWVRGGSYEEVLGWLYLQCDSRTEEGAGDLACRDEAAYQVTSRPVSDTKAVMRSDDSYEVV